MSVEGKKGVTDWRSLSSFCDMQSSALQPALGGGEYSRIPAAESRQGSFGRAKGGVLGFGLPCPHSPRAPPFLASAGLAELGIGWDGDHWGCRLIAPERLSGKSPGRRHTRSSEVQYSSPHEKREKHPTTNCARSHSPVLPHHSPLA